MKITQIVETTTSGSVATVATPLFKQSRKGGNLLTGIKTKKKYANSLSEGKMKELQMDISKGKDGLSDQEFKNKYGKTKDEMHAMLKKSQDNKKVDEAKLDEEDLIIVPGQGSKFKTGFIPHDKDRTDHEVEMALSDLYHAAKNAKQLHDMVSNISEEQGLEGWVQEKIIKAADYLNTVREYLEHKQAMSEQHLGGVIGSGFAGEAVEDEVEGGPLTKAQDALSVIFRIAKTGKPELVKIGTGSGTITQPLAKSIIQFYQAYKNKGKENQILEVFLDKELFKNLLRSKTFRKLVSQNALPQASPEGLRGAAIYKHMDKATSGEQKPKIDIVAEKAVSKAQQKFMGMVHAAQKGEKPASAEVAKVAKTMPKKAAKEFAQTKHKGLPEKKKD